MPITIIFMRRRETHSTDSNRNMMKIVRSENELLKMENSDFVITNASNGHPSPLIVRSGNRNQQHQVTISSTCYEQLLHW